MISSFSLLNFTPIPFCNTYSMHTIKPKEGKKSFILIVIFFIFKVKMTILTFCLLFFFGISFNYLTIIYIGL